MHHSCAGCTTATSNQFQTSKHLSLWPTPSLLLTAAAMQTVSRCLLSAYLAGRRVGSGSAEIKAFAFTYVMVGSSHSWELWVGSWPALLQGHEGAAPDAKQTPSAWMCSVSTSVCGAGRAQAEAVREKTSSSESFVVVLYRDMNWFWHILIKECGVKQIDLPIISDLWLCAFILSSVLSKETLFLIYPKIIIIIIINVKLRGLIPFGSSPLNTKLISSDKPAKKQKKRKVF